MLIHSHKTLVFGGLLLIQDAWSVDPPVTCIAANCNTYQEINILYCHINPARFCQCRPTADNGWDLEVMPCPEPETVFSFRHQVCVHPSMRDQLDCIITEGTLDPGCEEVSCKTYEEINTLSCHSESGRFCQCRPVSTQKDDPNKGLFEPISMPCAKGTLFNFRLQTCSREELWTNTCP
ncbi:hypothetical protein RP20_CCG015748 [Aedes albopictus]|nr:hypothetical protein RP20_CCG015748 [Aedes albopictus]